MTKEQVKITSCHVVYQATVEMLDDDGKSFAECFEIGSRYSIDVMTLSEDNLLRKQLLPLVEFHAQIVLGVDPPVPANRVSLSPGSRPSS